MSPYLSVLLGLKSLQLSQAMEKERLLQDDKDMVPALHIEAKEPAYSRLSRSGCSSFAFVNMSQLYPPLVTGAAATELSRGLWTWSVYWPRINITPYLTTLKYLQLPSLDISLSRITRRHRTVITRTLLSQQVYGNIDIDSGVIALSDDYVASKSLLPAQRFP